MHLYIHMYTCKYNKYWGYQTVGQMNGIHSNADLERDKHSQVLISNMTPYHLCKQQWMSKQCIGMCEVNIPKLGLATWLWRRVRLGNIHTYLHTYICRLAHYVAPVACRKYQVLAKRTALPKCRHLRVQTTNKFVWQRYSAAPTQERDGKCQ